MRFKESDWTQLVSTLTSTIIHGYAWVTGDFKFYIYVGFSTQFHSKYIDFSLLMLLRLKILNSFHAHTFDIFMQQLNQ